MAGGAASAQKIRLAERRSTALELRKAGLTYRDIAAEMRKLPGVGETYRYQQAHRDVMYELKRILTEVTENAQEVLNLELERLDDIWRVVWDKAVVQAELGGEVDWPAIDRLLRLMERRARLLGLDQLAPEQAALASLPLLVYSPALGAAYDRRESELRENAGEEDDAPEGGGSSESPADRT